MRSLAITLAFCASLSAQDLWVDATAGSDTNPGTAALPLQSITVALQTVTPGFAIYVRPGTYSNAATNEQLPLQFGTGMNHAGVTLYGFPGAVLDLMNARGNAVQVGTLANGGRITGMTFANMDKTDWWTRTISGGTYNGQGSATGFEVDRCHFIDCNRGIVLWQGVPIVGWRIHDNLFLRLGNDCINEFDVGSANEFTDNTFVSNPQLGVLSDADLTLVANNIFNGVRVGVASSASPAAANVRVRNNDFWQNTRDTEGNAFPNGVPPGNFAVDPMFVNPANDDYHLTSQSQLIDAGDPNPIQRADLDNVPGAVDSDMNGSIRTDVGAYETTPVSVTGSATNGQSFTFQVSTTATNLQIGLVVFAFDEGLILLGGISPVLLDPNTLIVPGFTGVMPYGATLPIPWLPPGFRLVFQGFAFDVNAGRLISGAAVRLQF